MWNLSMDEGIMIPIVKLYASKSVNIIVNEIANHFLVILNSS